MCETRLHLEVCIKAANAKKHIYVNKLLAPTFKEASTITQVVRDNSVVMITMLSRLHEEWCIKIREYIQTGKIGKIISIKMWHAHGIVTKHYPSDGMGYLYDGHKFLSSFDGGGACYADMCHPQYMLPYFLDKMPFKAYSRMTSITNRGDGEDNAVCLLEFENGPYAVLEAGWANGPITTDIIIHGTDGTILYRDDRSDLNYNFFGIRYGNNETFEKLPIVPAKSSSLTEWINCIQDKKIPEENMKRAIDLSLLNEAAYISAEKGSPVLIKELIN
jgi:1,5-anhydro-D-fructose reductase (1,5-anhydro-D-mannitol-forming)